MADTIGCHQRFLSLEWVFGVDNHIEDVEGGPGDKKHNGYCCEDAVSSLPPLHLPQGSVLAGLDLLV